MAEILVIHPEGNINSNPFLNGAVRALCGLGHGVTVVSARQAHPQEPPCQGCRLHLVDPGGALLPEARAWDCVLGVDALGIATAAPLAKRCGARLGLVSFEILFEGETGIAAKLPEILACRELDFAVVQDDVRAALLHHENRIPRRKIVTVPLAAAGARPRRSAPGRLHARFGLPEGTRIALMAGSFVSWAANRLILETASVWPDDWRILVNAHHGLREQDRALIALNDTAGRFLISDAPLPDVDDLRDLTDQVDIGLALYTPTFVNAYTGNNVKYIGMASGKIASYLRHGLPVLCNEIGTMSEAVARHRLGVAIRSMAEIPLALADYRRADHEDNCLAYFCEHLDLDRTIGPFLDAVLGR